MACKKKGNSPAKGKVGGTSVPTKDRQYPVDGKGGKGKGSKKGK